jgi:diguanylate cyclase (GGDEF)-like protein
MKIAPILKNESQRLAALTSYEILDTKSEEIFDTITHIAALVCNTPISLISLVDFDRQFFKSVHGDMNHADTPRDVAFCAHVINQFELMEIQDAVKDKRFLDNPLVLKDPRIRFYAGVPLTTDDKCNLGTLCVIGRKPQSLSSTQKEVLKHLSHIVMTLFEARKQTLNQSKERTHNEEILLEAKLMLEKNLKDMQQQHQEMTLLTEMSRILQACRVPEEAYTSLEAYCKQIFPGANGSICIIQESADTLVAAKNWGLENYSKNYFSADACWALRRGQYYQANDSSTDLTCRHFDIPGDAGTVATLCVPLMVQATFTGVLTLQFSSVQSGYCIGERQRILAIALAEQTALALANINLRAALYVQSNSDSLTGLFNQKLLENDGNNYLKEAETNKQTAAVILIDIDNFTKINNTHGHEAGNIVLQKVAELLKMNTRPGETPFRLTNDEMLLFIPDAANGSGAERAEAIRKAASHLHIRLNGAPLDSVTLSAGVAIFPAQAENIKGLILKAQHALSHAKKNGGNKIEMAKDKRVSK